LHFFLCLHQGPHEVEVLSDDSMFPPKQTYNASAIGCSHHFISDSDVTLLCRQLTVKSTVTEW
jgi:hypothetical protein